MISTILVTDDNILDNAILRNYLYKERVNIVSVLNGREALDMVESRNVDVIILDLVMPVLDGFGFLEEFCKMSSYKEIPVIIASNIEMDQIEKVLNYDIYDFIPKPINEINRMVVVNKVRKAIQFRKMISQLKLLESKVTHSPG
ncbi:response regulator [Clostridium sp. BNL1100]|uniref:response regulator n=1 Tax=Clostridium sp. BNL1100 TaxID=755731 RepID=UPI00024A7BC0|nr:response regulator [Clostridium sp. BNL1100]AEY66644.1 response regulator with CheY-like receiver, AAA-type ATPase, and DNA-binding domains [Clostridium sp. BNL1100]